MKSPWGSVPHHSRIRRAAFGAFVLALCAGAPRADAAAVNVRVSDQSGKSLANAVVMLEPMAGKLPVAPMSGVEISQIKRRFSPPISVVTVGTPVSFPNLDSVRHHVYSFSPAKQFELKLYAGVPARPVVFDKAGVAVIGCNIHDSMVAWVVVVDTPLHAMSETGGRAHLASVPAGLYQLRVWHAGLRAGQEMQAVAVSVAGTDVDQDVRLDVQGSEP
jgi:plastocyanin